MGAATSLTAAARRLLVVLLSVSAVQSQSGWGVNYNTNEICALKGTSVVIGCKYTYPSRVSGRDIRVEETFWLKGDELLDVQPSNNNNCTLIITDTKETDSTEYIFIFITNHKPGEKYSGLPGVTLTVTGLQVQVRRSQGDNFEFECRSSCRLPGSLRYVWYKNGERVHGQTSESYSHTLQTADRLSCAVEGYERLLSPSVYAPEPPSVSVSPSAEIVEGSSLTLTCSSDANPAAKYTWHKESGNPDLQPVSRQSKLVFSSIQRSSSGQYYCVAMNDLGRMISEIIIINVKYAPRVPSVSVKPPAEIVEGSSVTLTCSSDANPAAKYTWYKKSGNPDLQPVSRQSKLVFSSIQPSDFGEYYCAAMNDLGEQQSKYVFIDLMYAPQFPFVSVSPSAVLSEGSSVTLTCSSDAKPAATYNWYKENDDSPKASGQVFTIADVRPEHSGNYYCVAQNSRGRHNNSLHLTVVAGNSTTIMNIIRLTLAVLILLFVLLSLWMWRRKTLSSTAEPREREEVIEFNSCPAYENISAFTAAQPGDTGQREVVV